jgi:hypothetical protein
MDGPWRRKASKARLLTEDRDAFLPLPAGSFDACRKLPTRANSLSLVRFDRNDYSVPVAFAHHEILAKGYVNRVQFHKQWVVAEHRRGEHLAGQEQLPPGLLEMLFDRLGCNARADGVECGGVEDLRGEVEQAKHGLEHLRAAAGGDA